MVCGSDPFESDFSVANEVIQGSEASYLRQRGPLRPFLRVVLAVKVYSVVAGHV